MRATKLIIEKAHDFKDVYESLQCSITIDIPPSIDIWETNKPKPNEYQGILRPLNKYYLYDHQTHKTLILGGSSCGKSTLFRSLKQIYGNGFEEEEYIYNIRAIKEMSRYNCVGGILRFAVLRIADS